MWFCHVHPTKPIKNEYCNNRMYPWPAWNRPSAELCRSAWRFFCSAAGLHGETNRQSEAFQVFGMADFFSSQTLNCVSFGEKTTVFWTSSQNLVVPVGMSTQSTPSVDLLGAGNPKALRHEHPLLALLHKSA